MTWLFFTFGFNFKQQKNGSHRRFHNMGKLAWASRGSSQLEFLSRAEEHAGALSQSVARYFRSALDWQLLKNSSVCAHLLAGFNKDTQVWLWHFTSRKNLLNEQLLITDVDGFF